MTLMQLQYDMMLFAVLLLAGFAAREVWKPLQKLFLPASVIGGVIGLVLGQQVLGWIEIPKTFSQFPGRLIDLIMTALLFGIVVSIDKIKQFATYSTIAFTFWGFQAGAGMLMGHLFSYLWIGLPLGWGLMGVYSYNGGHGAAGVMGNLFIDTYGIQGNLDIGMLFSTIGIICAMVIGMFMVNLGIRRGWSAHVREVQKQPDWYYRGPLPDDQRKPIGKTSVTGASVNGLAFQLAILLFALFIGQVLLRDNLAKIDPFFNRIPSMTWGIVGSAILWPLLIKTRLDRYVDVATIKSITGMCLEIVILGAVSTISIKLLQTYWLPLAIYSAVMVFGTLFFLLWACRRFFKAEWFENCMMLFGRGTGVAANGLALVRAMDPESKSDVAVADGVNGVVYLPFTVLMVLWPEMLVKGQTWGAIAIGLAIMVVSGALMFVVGKKKSA